MTDLSYTSTDRIGVHGTFGLVVLQTDETIEHDLHRMLPSDGVALYASRIANDEEVTGDTLAAMAERLPRSTGMFPNSLAFDVVGYGCTSGTSVIGPQNVAKLVREGCTATHVTEPVSALIAACAALGVGSLGFVSPYIEEVNTRLRDVLASQDIQSPVFGSFNEGIDAKVARIDGPSIVAGALSVGSAQVDAVFLSCTNLRTLDVIEQIEAELDKPVLASNQVLAWHMAKLAGLPIKGMGPGRLFAT
ncbi:maleate cis-trans isomerase family protein [Algirhabdus cladophorae]|uniref:maleate cis-trans isomerase family protein n=1 Tax=Algirhabdus cladophorae TaxID=3377108 RepID=UPI003B8477CB